MWYVNEFPFNSLYRSVKCFILTMWYVNFEVSGTGALAGCVLY
ncbi:hypothetical protein [Clostridioides difficile]